MKKIFTLLAFLLVLGANAQQQETVSPDYASIEKNIKDTNSPYYYANLMKRYNAADTGMTIEERRHLYYGFALLDKKTDEAQLKGIQNKLKETLHKADPTNADFENVVAYTGTLLQAYPFSINMKEYRIYCLKALNRYEEAAKEKAQTDIIIDAMLSSGDGTSPENCIHVIDIANEYELVGILGFETKGEEYLISNKYNYLVIDKNSYDLPGLFFDVNTAKAVTGL
ncbi:DUF4919 domain-containing protein [Flavobacterium subsaxonicum]|uniref:DUF4919 domain-containing protein n=1 Tax=Flavobacterium subsaxonicum TaxID=426226 RepID=UPI00041C6477|nr:DUF4919 domain-containing protein [Flavobacterium subsaxonicum]